MSEQQALVERLFDEVINAGELNVADELFASDYIDHGPKAVAAVSQHLPQRQDVVALAVAEQVGAVIAR
jgi:predicted SnoaL-like aldol condensation-catalyzing enzyme